MDRTPIRTPCLPVDEGISGAREYIRGTRLYSGYEDGYEVYPGYKGRLN